MHTQNKDIALTVFVGLTITGLVRRNYSENDRRNTVKMKNCSMSRMIS